MIVNFSVTHIESKTYMLQEEFRKYRNININYDINLRNPSVSTMQTPFGKSATIKVEYALSINYLNPSIGQIRFEGSANYYTKEDMDDIKKQWDSGSAPIAIQNEIANTTVLNLAPLAISISKSMGLPPAIPIPTINFEKHKQKQTEAPSNYYV